MYLITGGTGQLGTELTKLLEYKKLPAISLSSDEMDILDKERVRDVIKKENPTIVFHCAAFTAVDNAEDEQKDLNWQVNVEGTRLVAEVCKELDVTLVYVSTDYVFDGQSNEEYSEESPTNPLNEYGKAKLAGEEVVKNLLDKYYIIRTSWVFGEYGPNFVFTMKKLAKKHDTLTVINDQIGRPTWTKTLAEFMLHLTATNQPFGIYHLSNQESCSWYEFAKAILKEDIVEVKPILTEDYPQKAIRPKTCIMNLNKALKTNFNIPTWQEALEEFENSLK